MELLLFTKGKYSEINERRNVIRVVLGSGVCFLIAILIYYDAIFPLFPPKESLVF